jgi:acetyl-CoA/propionyl-CoA carboxylase biotin carboxyl carrier protein
MFHTVLIANRGEIACRIIRTLRRLGIRSVAVYSDADAGARHVHFADVAVRLGPAPASQSYLDIERVIAAARSTGAQAIHPGYGFLAENAAFARACEENGIVFIGPDPEAIGTMGDKITAKLAVHERGVPTVPGVARPGMTDEQLIAEAPAVGYPLLIKPSAGGGGKGMHVVEAAGQLAGSLAAARREAAASFGDDTLFLERYVQNPRHIEVQVLADAHGNVIHLGERECSLQRRHQKVIEEAPSPLLDETTRARIGQAACDTARSVDYLGAGTVEFIVAADRPEEFFFMEMNTRLQVEHPVTEEITDLDLVEQQLLIAAGEPLRYQQGDIVLNGHSFEARLYSEDAQAGFLPTGGVVRRVRHATGDGVRTDTALEDGIEISSDYDPMLAKVITWGADRAQARQRLVAALQDTAVFGVTTNVEFLRLLLELPAVAAGDLDTGLIARHFDDLNFAEPVERDAWEAALLMDATTDAGEGPWGRRNGWRLGAAAVRRYDLTCGDVSHTVRVGGTPESPTILTGDGELPASVRLGGPDPTAGEGTSTRVTVSISGESRSFPALAASDAVELGRAGALFSWTRSRTEYSAAGPSQTDLQMVSPMPGTVVMIHVADGDRVEPGDAVVVVEAMKMEHAIRATGAGTVRLDVAVGSVVSRGQRVAEIASNEADEEEES